MMARLALLFGLSLAALVAATSRADPQPRGWGLLYAVPVPLVVGERHGQRCLLLLGGTLPGKLAGVPECEKIRVPPPAPPAAPPVFRYVSPFGGGIQPGYRVAGADHTVSVPGYRPSGDVAAPPAPIPLPATLPALAVALAALGAVHRWGGRGRARWRAEM